MDDLLYDSPARWSLRRFGLDLYVISCFQLHALTLLRLAGHRRDTRNDANPVCDAADECNHPLHTRPAEVKKMCERWMRRERWREERFDEELRYLFDERERSEPPVPVVEHERDEQPADADRPPVEVFTRA